MNPVVCGLLALLKTFPPAAPDPPLLPVKGLDVLPALPPPPNMFDVGAALLVPNRPGPLEAGGLLADPNS